MNVEAATLSEEKAVARRKYREYRTALKVHKQEYIAALASIYWQLARGRRLLDVAKAIAEAGANARGEPKLAIARADLPAGRFELTNGLLKFELSASSRWNREKLEIRVPEWAAAPAHLFGRAPTPIIPPAHLPLSAKGNPIELANYHLLWEVEKWDSTPPDDPILLRRLDGALFVIVSAWDLSPAEKFVMQRAMRV